MTLKPGGSNPAADGPVVLLQLQHLRVGPHNSALIGRRLHRHTWCILCFNSKNSDAFSALYIHIYKLWKAEPTIQEQCLPHTLFLYMYIYYWRLRFSTPTYSCRQIYVGRSHTHLLPLVTGLVTWPWIFSSRWLLKCGRSLRSNWELLGALSANEDGSQQSGCGCC